jgi:hypothetical protein
MNTRNDPFDVVVVEELPHDFDTLSRKSVGPAEPIAAAMSSTAVTARFQGFDLDDRPLLVGLPGRPQEIVRARSTVPLLPTQVGATVVLLFDEGDPSRPIVVGILQERAAVATGPESQEVSVQADEDRFVITADREIVLRCGDASITLTRAGKILIKGTYVLSRSSGYNKIKGAAVDIN